MAKITQEHVDGVVAACRSNLDAIADSLKQCFDIDWEVELTDPRRWEADDFSDFSDELTGPGLTIAIGCGEAALVCLLPESLPLPEWYADAGPTSQARLQTLAMEWSMTMLPDDLPADAYAAIMSSVLHRDVKALDSFGPPTFLELTVRRSAESSAADGQDDAQTDRAQEGNEQNENQESEDSTGEAKDDDADSPSASSASRIAVVFPVAKPLMLRAGMQPQEQAADNPPASGGGPGPKSAGSNRPAQRPLAETPQDRHLLSLPVTVSVRLAEKRVELGHLLSLTPGSLITFNKACEAPLELFVDGYLYCRGEAVKVGEKFGLKIDEVGVTPTEERHIVL